MNKILVSSCLLGCNVRYDGGNTFIDHPIIEKYRKEKRLVSACPEMLGGLSVPRPACEIVGGDGDDVHLGSANVLTETSEDYSKEYILGAKKVLKLVKENDIKIAILKKNSPSCGNEQIYDGSFSGIKIDGVGVVSSLLMQNNVKVFNEDQLLEVDNFLKKLENS